MKSGCATALVLNKWDLTGGDGRSPSVDLDHERARVRAEAAAAPARADRQRHDRPPRPAPAAPRRSSLADRTRRPHPDAGAQPLPRRGRRRPRQPPAKQGHRLKLLYMTQIGERPPRFAIQVNSRQRVTRDYAYFVENRLRERYGLDGVPLIIDFVERKQRARGELTAMRRAATARCEPPLGCLARHEPACRQRVPVHVRVRHRGPPGQDRRPDLRRRARRRAARRPVRPRGLRDAREHRPRRRLRRDLDRRPTSTSRRSRARRSARSATPTPTSASAPTPARSSTRSTSSRPTSRRASTRPTRRAPTPPTTTSSTSPARATRA